MVTLTKKLLMSLVVIASLGITTILVANDTETTSTEATAPKTTQPSTEATAPETTQPSTEATAPVDESSATK